MPQENNNNTTSSIANSIDTFKIKPRTFYQNLNEKLKSNIRLKYRNGNDNKSEKYLESCQVINNIFSVWI